MTHARVPALRGLVVTTLLAVGFGANAWAADGDATAGSAKAGTCTACHGLNGNSTNPEWPVLAGQNANYLKQQIAAFRDGRRKNELMLPMVQSLTDADIADLAAFFSTQTPTGSESDPSYWKAGEKLYRAGDGARGIPACAACHGPVGRGNPAAGYPALQAQHAVYTIKQLGDYAAASRYGTDESGKSLATANAHMMNLIATLLSAEDRRDLASYIQGIR